MTNRKKTGKPNKWRERKYSQRVVLDPNQKLTVITKKDDNFWGWYREYLQTDSWKALRLRVFERDGYKCVRCPNTNGLQVHHKTYVRVFQENLADLETLCDTCHKEQHKPHFTSP